MKSRIISRIISKIKSRMKTIVHLIPSDFIKLTLHASSITSILPSSIKFKTILLLDK